MLTLLPLLRPLLLRSILLLPLTLLFAAMSVLTASAASAAPASKSPITDLTVIARQLEHNATPEQELPHNKVLNVCAVPQLYSALQALSSKSRYPFVPRVATATEIYALIANTDNSKLPLLCDMVLSADERLPISLVRSQKALASSLVPFARVPLVLWSANPNLLQGHDPRDLRRQGAITSMAVANPKLTPVGFATEQVLKGPLAISGTRSLREHLYRADHEYQVYSMVANANVDCGFISKPLLLAEGAALQGSYWEVPRRYHPDIQYYGVLLSPSVANKLAQDFLRYLVEDEDVHRFLNDYGFAPLRSSF